MKNKVSKFLPILFLLLAITFMTLFKHEDTLSDSEKYEFEALNSIDHTIDQKANLKNSLNNKTYMVDSNGDKVTVLDAEENPVFQTTENDWQENFDFYSKKYNLN